jgi:hypothetical protein
VAAAHAFFTHSIQAAKNGEKVGTTREKPTSSFLLCAKHRYITEEPDKKTFPMQ